jgi:hypothetical protein
MDEQSVSDSDAWIWTLPVARSEQRERGTTDTAPPDFRYFANRSTASPSIDSIFLRLSGRLAGETPETGVSGSLSIPRALSLLPNPPSVLPYAPRTAEPGRSESQTTIEDVGDDVGEITLLVFKSDGDSRVVVDGGTDTWEFAINDEIAYSRWEIAQLPDWIEPVLTSIGIRALRTGQEDV